MSQELITTKDVAAILHVTEDTVRIYISEGKLPAYKVGRSYLVDRKDVDEFLRKRRTTDDKG